MVKEKLKKARWLIVMWFNASYIFNKVNARRYVFCFSDCSQCRRVCNGKEFLAIKDQFWEM